MERKRRRKQPAIAQIRESLQRGRKEFAGRVLLHCISIHVADNDHGVGSMLERRTKSPVARGVIAVRSVT